MASSRFEDSNYAKKLFRLSSLFYGARRRLSFFLTRVDNDSRGGIQLSDYRMGALIDTVDNHEGPVCSHSIAFLLLKRTGSQYHTGSTSFMDLARFFEKLNARYVETVSTWVEGLLRDISKRVSQPNGCQNLKKTYSDLQRQHVGPQKLKEALGALGLKVGGTLQQHAERLFLTKTKSLKCSNFSFRTTTVRLSAFDVQASQLHQNLFRVRVELTVIVSTRISPKFVGGQNHLSTISSGASCSTSSTKYGGVKKIASVTVSELNAYALNASSSVTYYGQKLKETDIAIGSGEIPVNPTPLLNETTTAAQTTLMKA
ncbi:hypothetical protein HID58_033009 [Brassica napus]|uniref:SDE2/SF3A3 SAP domain-containing protein n=1 Tax=Brassica napus TaxID=3708 RepID=A0ABQ8BY25_BRANA|nr:hypothetical protein HID58_033009 [Brassica napus]